MIYEYRCSSCAHITERIRKVEEADNPCSCEVCEAVTVRVCMSVPSKASWKCECPTASGGK